jgi:hypothetical protein
MNVQQTKQLAQRLDPSRVFPLTLVSLVAVTVGVDLLLAFQPAMTSPLRERFQHWVGTGSWSGLFASSISVLCVAVTAAILATFVRGVKSAPYVWLASMFVSTCTLVMNGVSAELPWPIPSPLFAVLSALLLIGGGEVFLLGSRLRMVSGVMLSFAPLALLAIGYAQSNPIASFNSNEQLFAAILALTSVGTLTLSTVSQRILEHASDRDSNPQASDYLRTQIIQLLERCNATEARALRAEQQLAQHVAFPMRENR